MYEEVFSEYYDSGGNYHMWGTVTGHRIVYALRDDEYLECEVEVNEQSSFNNGNAR